MKKNFSIFIIFVSWLNIFYIITKKALEYFNAKAYSNETALFSGFVLAIALTLIEKNRDYAFKIFKKYPMLFLVFIAWYIFNFFLVYQDFMEGSYRYINN